MRSTNLRKHVSTLSQVVNLKDNELDILAQFLGHDVRIHRDFYRLPEDTLQMAKVGKLLMAMNKGTINNYAGKSLDDITFDEEVTDESKDETDTEKEEVEEIPVAHNAAEQFKEMTYQQPRKRCAPRKWTTAEKEAVRRTLGKFLDQGKLPGKSDCISAQRKEPCLGQRCLEMIRQFVRNSNKVPKVKC